MSAGHLSASEAATALGIRVDTLYAYVSRGLIRSVPGAGGKRRRRYYGEDIRRLQERKEQRRDPTKAVAQALHLGAPVLESAITLIADGRLYYRGRDVLTLATSSSIEQTASLIWTDVLPAGDATFPDMESRSLLPQLAEIRRQVEDVTPVESFQALLPLAAAADLAAHDLRPEVVARAGARIMSLLVAIAVGSPAGNRVARTLQHRWAPQIPHAATLFDSALILCADHELNASTFAVRCVASTGATPYAAVGAGLAAASGTRHIGQTERVYALLRTPTAPSHALSMVRGYLRRGEPVPGFGQALYPEGDPRAALLLRLVRDACPDAPAVAVADAVADAAYQLLGEHPNIDFAIATLARALALPHDAAFTLFVLGRTVGWIGHAIEQYASDRVIRPRARYVGKLPASDEKEGDVAVSLPST